MILSLSFVILSLFVVAFIILHIKLFDFKSSFSNAIVNFLFIIGGYALFMTHLKSIYLLPIMFLLIRGLIIKNWNISLTLKDWKITLLITSFVSCVFLIFFWRFNYSIFTNEDFLFWVRVGITNQRLGVENINVFYNFLGVDYNGLDLYHLLELWCMNFGNVINGQPHELNLYLFAYPLAVVIACFGLKELIILKFYINSKRLFFVVGSVVFIVFGLLFFAHPWETVVNAFGINGLPISGIHPAYKNMKIFLIWSIVLAILLYLKESTSERFIIMIVSLFFYIPVLPLVMVAIFFWLLYQRYMSFRTRVFDLYFFLLLGLSFILIYVLFGNQNGTTISGFSLNDLFSTKYWAKILPAIIMKTFVISAFGFLPVLLLGFTNRHIVKSKTVQFLGFLLPICIGVWIIFAKNIDANQSFLLLFGSILPMLAIIIIWQLVFIKKRIYLGALFMLIYIYPELIKAYSFKSSIPKDTLEIKEFVQNLGKNDRLLFLPNGTDLNIVYDFNERVYTGVNQFILYNPNVVIFSLAGAMKTNTSIFSSSSDIMYQFYRDISPYYKECGYFDITSPCFYTFLKKYHISVICSKNEKLQLTGWKRVTNDIGYYFYKPL